jgi:hypothetical protein
MANVGGGELDYFALAPYTQVTRQKSLSYKIRLGEFKAS